MKPVNRPPERQSAAGRPPRGAPRTRARIVLLIACANMMIAPAVANAAVGGPPFVSAQRATGPEAKGSSLESAAAKAGNTGRAVAMSLIGLAFAVAATVLAFRRDFKEAAGVFAVGIVSVLLATPAGVSLLRDTVTSLFGSG
jgi:hypothetical protein